MTNSDKSPCAGRGGGPAEAGTDMALTPVDLAELERVACALADAARPETLRHFRVAGLIADNKDAAGFDPVTEADRAAERAMRAALARLRPHDGVLGEEFGTTSGDSGLTWVLDPIDGTRGYISGTPTWGVLVAVGPDDGAPLLGVIDQPYIGERFVGSARGAWCEGPAGRLGLAVSGRERLGEAILFSTFPEVGTPQEGAAFARVAAQARLTRYGMDCYAYALLAAGQVDLVIEAGLSAYDIQAPMAVIQAAGGLVTNWRGGPAHAGGQVVAAASRALLDQALEILNAEG